MVFCELIEPLGADFGERIIRLPQNIISKLDIEEGDILEVISSDGKRLGVFAYLDHHSAVLDEIRGIEKRSIPDSPIIPQIASPDDGLPKPEGKPFVGIEGIEREGLAKCRLDGEVRLSLGVKIGDIIEVDTVLKPAYAKKIYYCILGVNPSSLSDEEKGLISDQLRYQISKPLSAGLIININFAFKQEQVLIQSCDPDTIVVPSTKTSFELLNTFVPQNKEEALKVTYEDVGGYKEAIHRLRHLVEIPILKPEVFKKINLVPPRGILIEGSTGVGKTLILRALANETGCRVIEVPSNLFAGVGPTEKNIRDLFEKVRSEARKKPVLLILDNMESLTPAPNVNLPLYIKRFTTQFALGFDSLRGTNTIIIGACHSTEDIDPILRRPGRFDVEIEIPIPSELERLEILNIHLRRVPKSNEITREILRTFAHRMVGYVGADISQFVKEACMRAVGRNVSLFSNLPSQIPRSILRTIQVTVDDLEEAYKITEPSAYRSIHSKLEVPNVTFDDIGGLKEVKQLLKEQIKWRFEDPDTLKQMGVKPSSGLLLYGPPGTGKTLLAKALATEMHARFISIKGPELLSVWFGESARIIRQLFKRAQKLAPCILFFDEIDAMVPRRGSDADSDGGQEIDATVNQLLTLLDGMDSSNDEIFIIGATNRPNALDTALLRPGRLDRLVLTPPPDLEGRKEIIRVHTKKVPLVGDREEMIIDLAKLTEDFSGADIENLVREAVLASLRENFNQREVSYSHFQTALALVSPSIDQGIIKHYEQFVSEVLGSPRNVISSQKPFTYG